MNYCFPCIYRTFILDVPERRTFFNFFKISLNVFKNSFYASLIAKGILRGKKASLAVNVPRSKTPLLKFPNLKVFTAKQTNTIF